jgi:hypothetical protein
MKHTNGKCGRAYCRICNVDVNSTYCQSVSQHCALEVFKIRGSVNWVFVYTLWNYDPGSSLFNVTSPVEGVTSDHSGPLAQDRLFLVRYLTTLSIANVIWHWWEESEWVLGIGGMALTGKTRVVGRNTVVTCDVNKPVSDCPWTNSNFRCFNKQQIAITDTCNVYFSISLNLIRPVWPLWLFLSCINTCLSNMRRPEYTDRPTLKQF